LVFLTIWDYIASNPVPRLLPVELNDSEEFVIGKGGKETLHTESTTCKRRPWFFDWYGMDRIGFSGLRLRAL